MKALKILAGALIVGLSFLLNGIVVVVLPQASLAQGFITAVAFGVLGGFGVVLILKAVA